MRVDLWDRLRAVDLDQPQTPYSFSIRVANENFWTRNFTKKAILEYKKFMYLAATNDVMVSPSPIIDKVWHEHLMFSKSYENLCEVLGKQIRHVPSMHVPGEFEKFRAARERTEVLYKKAFGDPPADIWNHESMYDSLHLPKARINVRTALNICIITFVILTVIAIKVLRPLYVQVDNPQFVQTYLATTLFCFLGLEIWNRRTFMNLLKKADPLSFIFNLHPFEVIFLETEKLFKVINVPMNKIIEDNKVTIGRTYMLRLDSSSKPETPEEYEIFLAFEKRDGTSGYSPLVSDLSKAPIFTNISGSMKALKKYIWKSREFGTIFYVNVAVFGLMLIAGLARIAIGLDRAKPVEGLTFTVILLSAATAFYMYRLSRMMCTKIIPSYYKKVISRTRPDQREWEWKFLLMGSAALTPTFVALDQKLQRETSSDSWWSSSSCGSSSGSTCGSSCGSSCGGCGGD